MTRTRQWSLLTALLVVGVLAAGWFAVVAPKRSDAAALQGRANTQEQENVTQEQQIAMLKELAKDLPSQRAKLSVIQRQLPGNPALPTLIRDLSRAAGKSGVNLVSLSPAVPAPVVPVAVAPVAVVAAPAADGAAPSTDATGPAADGAAPAATVAPAAATESLNVMALQINVTGSFFEIEQFLNGVESLRRPMLVRSFDVAADATTEAVTGQLSLTLNAEVFLRSPAPVVAVATPVATSTATSTPVPSPTTSTN
jgi:Tfp pilus assembly protein PilO